MRFLLLKRLWSYLGEKILRNFCQTITAKESDMNKQKTEELLDRLREMLLLGFR